MAILKFVTPRTRLLGSRSFEMKSCRFQMSQIEQDKRKPKGELRPIHRPYALRGVSFCGSQGEDGCASVAK